MVTDTTLDRTNKIFFENNDLCKDKISRILDETLSRCDDGELYFENSNSETFFFDDDRMKSVSYDNSQGFGFRSILNDKIGYAHSGEINQKNILKASETVKSISNNKNIIKNISALNLRNDPLYTLENPLENLSFLKKVKLINEINEYARNLDVRIVQVSISLSGSHKAIQILNSDQKAFADIRPLVRLIIQIVVEQNNRRESIK